MGGKVDAKSVVLSIIDAIESRKAWLSEIDGAVGDGDHGVNMAKGMAMVRKKLDAAGGPAGNGASSGSPAAGGGPAPDSPAGSGPGPGPGPGLGDLLRLTGMTLLSNIGGAMGPIYGTLFMRMGKAIEGKAGVSGQDLLAMLTSALEGVVQRGGAGVGDKTLVDTLEPAARACEEALRTGAGFAEVVDRMIASARAGMESTKELVAKVGRSSRLGERSRGTIDAGAASCYLILEALGESLKKQL
jgi:dihydroxyacetone kinase phosphoprotein-dependent L subunit